MSSKITCRNQPNYLAVPWTESLRLRLVGITMLALSLLCVIMVLLLNALYQERVDIEYSARGESVARMAAYLIDGELLDKYLGTRLKDKEYEAILKHLDMIRIENDVKYLYVQKVIEGGAVFVWDTDPWEPVDLGEFDPWDESYDVIEETLLQGERVASTELHTPRWGHLMVVYEPVFRDDGSVSGYVGVNIAMEKIVSEKNSALVAVTSVVALIGLIVFAVNLYITQRNIIYPLNMMANNISVFLIGGADATLENTGSVSPRYKGELAALNNSITKMEHRVTDLVTGLEKAGAAERQINERMEVMLNALRTQNRLLLAVNKSSSILMQSNDVTFTDDLFKSMSILAKAAKVDRVGIWVNYLIDNERYCDQTLMYQSHMEPRHGRNMITRISFGNSIPGWEQEFLKKRCINGIVSKQPAKEQKILTRHEIKSIFAVPIYLKKQFWGFIAYDDCHNERVFSRSEASLLRSASELIANALIRSRMENDIKHLETEVDKIYYDALTGIFNRRYYDENIKRIFLSLSRSSGLLSVMLVDVDHFKRFNDTYGHDKGDVCLKKVASSLNNSVTRADDFVARYGGEEFIVVLPNTDESGVKRIANKILDNIRALNISHNDNDSANHVTVSIGAVTGRVEFHSQAEHYIRAADEMLYKSKYLGRNRYSFSPYGESKNLL